MAKNEKFKKGDKVRLKNGRTMLLVAGYSGNYVCAQYVSSGRFIYEREQDLVLWEEEKEKIMVDNVTLYEVKLDDGLVVLANHIGTNSANMWIMEERGNGKCHFVKSEQVSEVLPFTFSVRLNGKDTHFIGEPANVVKGDVLLYTGNGADDIKIVYVTAVNTKNKSAAKEFKGLRINTSPFQKSPN